jgi:hypothetical protein
MSFATKLAHMVYADGRQRDVMKAPKTDSTKYSLPGLWQQAGCGRGRLLSQSMPVMPYGFWGKNL